MKKIIISGFVALAIIVGGLFSVTQVHAQQSPESNQAARCNVAQGRLNTRISQANTTKDSHTKIYTDLEAKLDAVVSSAGENQYDTLQLTNAKNSVSAKIAAYSQKATIYAEALMATKNLSCGNSDSEFTTSLTASRTALAAVRTASADVRLAFKSEAIPALKDYAIWIKEQLASEETN